MPDLVIYLQAPVDTLVERVHRRGVDYERTISAHYLARLADAYSRYFYRYEAAPLLIVNSERLNFVDKRRPPVACCSRGSARCAASASSSTSARPPDAMDTPYTTPVPAPRAAPRDSPSPRSRAMARDGTKIAMLTAYDASFAALCERAGVDVLLVGDSLGMVIQGHDSTLPVTLADVLYHTRCVVAGCARALVIADLPFGSYQASPEAAYAASAAALKAGAQMVKLEGGAWLAPTVEFLVTRGVPVCGHVGLQPQSVNALGGYRVQGKTAGRRRGAARRCPRARRGGRRAARRRMRAASARRGADARGRHPGHRHRRGARLLGAGAGNLRRARHPARPRRALRPQFHGGQRQRRQPRLPRMWRR